jgi:geranylgeranyl pyrophosphate synthase
MSDPALPLPDGVQQVLQDMPWPGAADDPAALLGKLLGETFSETALRRLFGPGCSAVNPEHWERALHAPLRDFLGRRGKAFRARMVAACFAALHSKPCPGELPVLMEALHAGSLVVDDIEDGAVERRGAPALHRIYGMERALNAGNWLYFWPAHLLAQLGLPAETELQMHRALNAAQLRCHFGQALDLSLRVESLRQAEIPGLVSCATRLKTGSLMGCAASMGALAAGAKEHTAEAFHAFGSEIGTGLQMLDDLSSIVNEDRREKAREDLVNGRVTWAWAWAAAALPNAEFAALQGRAHEAGLRREPWEELRKALGAAAIEGGREEVHHQLHTAFHRLRPHVRHDAALAQLHAEITRLEHSYV